MSTEVVVPDASAGEKPAIRPGFDRAGALRAWAVRLLPVTGIVVVAAVLRFLRLTAVGFNSDEAVYAGTAAAISGDSSLQAMFPIFRAHPVLFQMLVSFGYRIEHTDGAARGVAAAIGVAAVLATYALGRRLYGTAAGLIAALLLAVTPYHVIVSRQVLLDGLMTLTTLLVLYCVVRYVQDEPDRARWLVAAGAMAGLSLMAKETSAVLVGGLYAFFALAPRVRLKARHALGALAALAAVAAPIPIVLSMSGRQSTGQNYLLWQMFRRANHETWFYFTTVPGEVGLAVIAAGAIGLVWLRRDNGWREGLLLCWIAVPIVFFTLWPVKGYQYLLPVAPVAAVLAGRTLARIPEAGLLRGRGRARDRVRAGAMAGMVAVVFGTIAVPAFARVNPAPTTTFLAGTGGLPGGREAALWVRDHVPAGAQLLAIGPSMANVLQFYSHRRTLALSVSSNPGVRNPSYTPVPNPDRAMRDGQFQYVVWDSYTASRAPFFAQKARALIDKYHGVAVYTGTVAVRTPSGATTEEPVIILYEVRPA
ncbi:glycosyltransferase family 39 protein [Streptosporangiaceae bacterium NEAU-GS5]|nr:glycosyltransferase family 39 protein [Streptosporangiaceae bacterium NEAU-GS5]